MRVELEAGPLSQWLYAGLNEAGVATVRLETHHEMYQTGRRKLPDKVPTAFIRRSWRLFVIM